MSRVPARWAVAVDLGGSSLKSGLVADDGQVEAFERTLLDRGAGAGALLAAIEQDIQRILTGAAKLGINPEGIGVGSPGSIDASGRIHKSPNIPAMAGFPLRERLGAGTELPVYLANDVNAAVLGELKFGAGRSFRSFVMVALGTGVGGGVVLDGRLHTGTQGFAGEVGHITVDPDGPPCGCGNVGCLEGFVGAPGLVQRACEILDTTGADGPLSRISPLEMDAEAISQAAEQGDAVALQVLREAGRWLGVALISVINLLDPECVLLGGGVAQAGGGLLETELELVLEVVTPHRTAAAAPAPVVAGLVSSVLARAPPRTA